MSDLYDEAVTDRPEDADVLTLEYLEGVLAKLRTGKFPEPISSVVATPEQWQKAGYIPTHLFLPRVIATKYLPDEQPRQLTRRERFWLWVESLCGRAEIYYYGPKIKRTEPAPGYLIGRDLYLPLRMATAIRETP